MTGIEAGSYSRFCSRANMLLFFTGDVRWSRSMEVRRVGDGEVSLFPNKPFSELKRLGVAGSRPCQKRRGDELPSEALKGDDWNGDESPLSRVFWQSSTTKSPIGSRGTSTCLGGLIEAG